MPARTSSRSLHRKRRQSLAKRCLERVASGEELSEKTSTAYSQEKLCLYWAFDGRRARTCVGWTFVRSGANCDGRQRRTARGKQSSSGTFTGAAGAICRREKSTKPSRRSCLKEEDNAIIVELPGTREDYSTRWTLAETFSGWNRMFLVTDLSAIGAMPMITAVTQRNYLVFWVISRDFVVVSFRLRLRWFLSFRFRAILTWRCERVTLWHFFGILVAAKEICSWLIFVEMKL